jgi:ankyrin repeat protein
MNKTTTCLFTLAAAMLLTGCQSPLNRAALRGDTTQVQRLLDKGVGVNSTTFGFTALMCAADAGKTIVVEQLLSKGADINATSGFGWTALSLAASCGQTECVKVLLEHGANVDPKNNNKQTALDLARAKGYTEIVKLISAVSRKGNSSTATPSVPTTLLPPAEQATPF